MGAAPDRVARYYDSNTARFLRFGRGGRTHAIHRELWGPGVRTPEEASAYVNRLLVERIRHADRRADGSTAAPGPVILDLGCGVGGTLLHLARAIPDAELRGITISARQAAIGARLVAERGLADRCRIRTGDFLVGALAAPGEDAPADVAVAVESFVHVGSATDFFAAASSHVRRGGLLLLVDDFLARPAGALQSDERRLVDDFRNGWRATGICTVDACVEAATKAGFELTQDVDLTALVRPGRLRDRVIARLAPLFRGMGLSSVPFFGNMIGGDALQRGLRAGALSYRLLHFESDAPTEGSRA